jgi:hypothetical protein
VAAEEFDEFEQRGHSSAGISRKAGGEALELAVLGDEGADKFVGPSSASMAGNRYCSSSAKWFTISRSKRSRTRRAWRATEAGRGIGFQGAADHDAEREAVVVLVGERMQTFVPEHGSVRSRSNHRLTPKGSGRGAAL